MTPPAPDRGPPRDLSTGGAYLAGGLGSLVVVAAVLLERSSGGLAPVVAVLPAAAGLVFRVGGLWAATLVLVAFLQIYPDGDLQYRAFPVAPARAGFVALDLALVAGVLGTLACQFRLLALRRAAPPDAPGGPTLARPPGPPAAGELTGLVVAVALAVVAGQAVHLLATRVEVEPGRSPVLVGVADNRPSSRAILAAGVGLALAAAGGLWGWYARAANQTPDQARAYLLDVAWAESRRELSRHELWRAWGRRPRPARVVRVRFLVFALVWLVVAGLALTVGVRALIRNF